MTNLATMVTTDADAQFISVIDTSPHAARASDAVTPTAALIATATAANFSEPEKLPFMLQILLLIFTGRS
jgi:hypothetical protein